MATAGARVKFAFGTVANFAALTTKDQNTLYVLTDGRIYLGTTIVANAGQVYTNTTAIGTLSSLSTSAKGNLVAAINEVRTTANNANSAASNAKSQSAVTVSETDGGYNIIQNGATVFTIPKDTAVSSGELVQATSSAPIKIGDTSYTSGDFLKLTIKNQTDPVYINVNELLNVYSGVNGAMVNVSVSGSRISASINDGSVTKAKLDSAVQTSLGKADTALQSIAAGSVTKAMLATAVQTSLNKADSAIQSIPGMRGATASAAGTAGSVPAPAAGDQGKFLRGDGTWQNQATYSAFKGATASAAGGAGLVPAPTAGAQARFLRGDGTWASTPQNNYSEATTDRSGLMSAADKTNLDDVVSALTWQSLA